MPSGGRRSLESNAGDDRHWLLEFLLLQFVYHVLTLSCNRIHCVSLTWYYICETRFLQWILQARSGLFAHTQAADVVVAAQEEQDVDECYGMLLAGRTQGGEKDDSFCPSC